MLVSGPPEVGRPFDVLTVKHGRSVNGLAVFGSPERARSIEIFKGEARWIGDLVASRTHGFRGVRLKPVASRFIGNIIYEIELDVAGRRRNLLTEYDFTKGFAA